MFVRSLLLALVFALNINVAMAASKASGFVDTLAQKAIAVVSTGGAVTPAKKAQLRTILVSGFDLNASSRFALGPVWRTITPAQQTQYQKLYQDMIVEVYSRRFADYTGQTFSVTGERADDNGDAIVSSVVKSKDSADVKVDWRIRQKGGAMKVVDVVVEGVSMAVTQRSDFASIIEQNGGAIEALFRYLKDQAAGRAVQNAAK